MDTFAFIIHPINVKRDVSRKFPTLGKLPMWLINTLSVFFPPVYISEITGVQSVATGREIKGWFVACPLTPAMMMKLPPSVVYRKIIQTGKLAERLGARMLGLGAFTSVVGDGGITIAKQLSIPVTTGDSYTIAVAVKAIREAAQRMDISLSEATLGVVGAYGAIGTVCAEMLASDVKGMVLVGRREEKLAELHKKVTTAGGKNIVSTTDISQLKNADLIITVTSAVDTVIRPEHLRQGAVICDVARPRDVSRQVAEARKDILVIEGGMVEIPGRVNFNFNFGFPPKMAYACMAETMALATERYYESFTLGKDIQLSQVMSIDTIATRHGFKLGGFRSFERAITDAEIASIRSYSRFSQSKIGSTIPNTI